MAPAQTSPLLRIPPEIRVIIYGLATALEHMIEVRGKECATPALAQTCSQLRKELIPIWLESNTFNIMDVTQIRFWLPLSTSTINLINNVTLTLRSSVMWYLTLKSYDLQPTKIIFPKDDLTATVDDICVIWESHARIIESLATNPREGVFKSISELSALFDERLKLDDQKMAALRL